MKKMIVIISVVVLFCFLFLDRCSIINITTADIFRPKAYKRFTSLKDSVASDKYVITPISSAFPILFDSIKSEFYLRNGKGLTKIDREGNVIITNSLHQEEYSSTANFANFIPYVFVKNGVYDFSGNEMRYHTFSEIINSNNEVKDEDFKTEFEKSYKEAELVVYETDQNIDLECQCYPMYFKINTQWKLIFSQKGEYRFTHLSNNLEAKDTIGQIDFEKFPAKFTNKKLIVLKDDKHKRYTIESPGMTRNTDEYFDTYYTQILKEKSFNYHSENTLKVLSYKKEKYYHTGGYWDFPDWVTPSFEVTAFFELTYNEEKLFFKENAIKYYSKSNIDKGIFLYELPEHERHKSKVAFFYYEGGSNYYNPQTGETESGANGLYIIKPKSKK
ncbi:hypothetical protein GCM10007384_03510 [Aquimarina muelleri]|uniref:Uncharacterized protein n=2 Tax=Aquimarina muelleri TaxID=279356 RepID=A0A918JRX4_9FLAO|nr:hypothetical protein GCM10007384_03510 [Aquimarina muelleri]